MAKLFASPERVAKKILRVYVLAPSYPPARGGQEIHLQELSESLIARGVGVRVVAAVPELPPSTYVDSVPVTRVLLHGPIQGAGWRSIPWIALLLARFIWRLLWDARRYDAVLVSGFNILPLAPVAAGLVTRKPIVVRPESALELKHAIGEVSRSQLGGGFGSILLGTVAALRRSAAARIDRYIAISAEIRDQLIGEGIEPERIVEVANGIDTDKFIPVDATRRAQLRASLGLPLDALLLIYTGRLAVSKGVLLLLDVWRELAPHHPRAHLVLVGDGAGSLDECESEARANVRRDGLERSVTFTGSVVNVDQYLQAADIFVFPSHHEGFALSILEAMAVGLPMVCTRVGVAADLERTAGIRLIVKPQDRDEFRDALQRLLTEPDLRNEAGHQARAAVQERYSMSVVAQRHADVFSTVTEKRS